MLACCKKCAYGYKVQHGAYNAQCAAGQAASINDLALWTNLTVQLGCSHLHHRGVYVYSCLWKDEL